MLFKGISYLELWQPFCFAEHNPLCNFGTEYYEKKFCAIILNLGQWFRRCPLKDFLSGALGWSRTIYAILKEGIMGNIMCSYMKFGPVVQMEMSFNEKIYGWTTEKTD